MNGMFRQSMAWLHTWTGLLVTWALFLIFFSGTVAYFNEEISAWMRPAIVASDTSPEISTQQAVAYLQKNAADAEEWNIYLPSKRAGYTQVYWDYANGEDQDVKLDGLGREVAVRDTKGGDFFYRFHYNLYYLPILLARIIVCSAAFIMLIAIITGIITHKKIFVDFFTLRFGKGQRSWLDVHNVSAVLALPFHLMITYTGLITLMATVVPFIAFANYEDGRTLFAALFPQPEQQELSNAPAPLLPIGPLVVQAQELLDGRKPEYVKIVYPGDAAATIQVLVSDTSSISTNSNSVVFSAVTGELLTKLLPSGAAMSTRGVLVGIHAGRFSDTITRWLYFLSGLAGTLMIASGAILWTVKRRLKLPDPENPHFGFRFVEKLNVGFLVGMPVGTACYFLANRLMPAQMPDRYDWEIDALFIGWGMVFLWSIVRPTKHAWIEGLSLAALLYAFVPIISAFTTERNLFVSFLQADWVFVSFDITMFVTAFIFAFAARVMMQRTHSRPMKRLGNYEMKPHTQKEVTP